MSPVEWFYAQENQRFGPVSAAELKALADAGKLRPEDLVWREGMDGWVPARRVKGLFETEGPTAAHTSVAGPGSPEGSSIPADTLVGGGTSAPVFSPLAVLPEAAGRGFEKSLSAFYRAREGGSIHLFDFLLDLFRRCFPAVLVEATCQSFWVVGYYTLYGAMVVLLLITLVESGDTKRISPLGWGVAGLIGLIVLQYTAGRFLPALDRLNKSSPACFCSTAFLDCLALLLLAIGVGSVLGLVVYGVQENQYVLLLWAVELFIVMEVAALVALAPETVQITISPETRAGEEALGIWTFLLKLLLKLTPVLFGLGVFHGTIELLYELVLLATKKLDSSLTVWTSFWYLAGAAALPVIVYLCFLSGYLTIDLMRAVLELPRLLQKNLSSAQQRTAEEE